MNLINLFISKLPKPYRLPPHVTIVGEQKPPFIFYHKKKKRVYYYQDRKRKYIFKCKKQGLNLFKYFIKNKNQALTKSKLKTCSY